MKTKAELFEATLTDENDIINMVASILEAGGSNWGENGYKVEFNDGSYYSGAVFFPQDALCYFNGSAKMNPEYKVLGSDGGSNVIVRLPDGRKVQTTRSNYFDPEIHVVGSQFGEKTWIVVNWD